MTNQYTELTVENHEPETLLRAIHSFVADLVETADDGEVVQFFIPTPDREIYVEHIIVGVDTMWAIGPIFMANGEIVREQYNTESFTEAARLLKYALA